MYKIKKLTEKNKFILSLLCFFLIANISYSGPGDVYYCITTDHVDIAKGTGELLNVQQELGAMKFKFKWTKNNKIIFSKQNYPIFKGSEFNTTFMENRSEYFQFYDANFFGNGIGTFNEGDFSFVRLIGPMPQVVIYADCDDF